MTALHTLDIDFSDDVLDDLERIREMSHELKRLSLTWHKTALRAFELAYVISYEDPDRAQDFAQLGLSRDDACCVLSLVKRSGPRLAAQLPSLIEHHYLKDSVVHVR